MKKYKFTFAALALSLISATVLTSCDEGGDPDPGGTSMQAYAGNWYVNITDTDGNAYVEHALFSTYNTAANDNTMWIDDDTNGWWLKAKVNVDRSAGTFNTDGAVPNIIVTPDGSDPGIVTITEGKIIKNGGTSRGGHVVDSIYFRAFYDYPGTAGDIELIHSGHKRTGFAEDEY